MSKSRNRGFTLVELVITLAVLGVLVALAVPGMADLLDRHRLVGGAEAVYAQIQSARSEAIKQSSAFRVSFDASTSNQCLGFRAGAIDCDCSQTVASASDACSVIADGTNSVLRVTSMSDHPGVRLALADTGTAVNTFSIDIDGTRGTTTASETTRTIRMTSPQGRELNVLVNPLGRVRLCVPTGKPTVLGFKSC